MLKVYGGPNLDTFGVRVTDSETITLATIQIMHSRNYEIMMNSKKIIACGLMPMPYTLHFLRKDKINPNK